MVWIQISIYNVWILIQTKSKLPRFRSSIAVLSSSSVTINITPIIYPFLKKIIAQQTGRTLLHFCCYAKTSLCVLQTWHLSRLQIRLMFGVELVVTILNVFRVFIVELFWALPFLCDCGYEVWAVLWLNLTQHKVKKICLLALTLLGWQQMFMTKLILNSVYCFFCQVVNLQGRKLLMFRSGVIAIKNPALLH